MKKEDRPKITLPPDLERIAGDLDWRERLDLARQLSRFVRQLVLSAFIMRADPKFVAGPYLPQVRDIAAPETADIVL